jgi:hypothetical protein
VPDFGDLLLRELHDVFDAIAGVDETDRVVLQADGGEGGELLLGRFLIGCFVAEAGENDGRLAGSGMESQGWFCRRVENDQAWAAGADRARV